MTDKQHLEAILKFLEKKGWDFWGLRSIAKTYQWQVKGSLIVFINTVTVDEIPVEQKHFYSGNDLLASHSMWACLVSEEIACDQCGYILHDNEDGMCYGHIKGGYTPIPANIYHISQCFQLPEQERLKYAAQFVKGDKQ